MALGGVVGTGLRLLADAALPHAAHEFPTSTLIVNVVGALTLGVLVGEVWKRPGLPRWLRAGLGAGVLGSFTTYSAIMVSLVGMGSADALGLAAIYLAASLVLGFGAAALGLRIGSAAAHRRMPRSIDDAGETL